MYYPGYEFSDLPGSFLFIVSKKRNEREFLKRAMVRSLEFVR